MSSLADLAWHGHNVRVWDSDQDQLDALRENLDYDRDDLDKEKLMLHKEFVVGRLSGWQQPRVQAFSKPSRVKCTASVTWKKPSERSFW